MQNFTASDYTGIDISSLFTSILGLTGASATHTVLEEVHVYASYDEDTRLMGETGIFNYYDEDVDCKGLSDEECADNNRTYIVIENEGTVLNWFLEAINELLKLFFDGLNALYQWITENPEAILYDYSEVYDETKEKNVLRKLAQNTHYYLNGNEGLDGTKNAHRDMLYTLYFELNADKSKLQIDGVTIAENKGIYEQILKIDSSNMQVSNSDTILGSLGEGASYISATYEQKDYAFPGVIDYSQTGIMKITETGKKYYTEGFSPVNDLDEEKNIRSGEKKNFEDTVGNLSTNLYRYNGLRFFAGRIKYKLDSSTGTDLTRDNLYYSDKVKGGTLYVFDADLRKNEYSEDLNKETQIKKKDAIGRVTTEKSIEILNAYTPIEVYASDHLYSPADVSEPESQLVDKFSLSGLASSYVVLESGFQLDIGIDDYSVDGKYDTILASDMKKYLKGFYLKFDFAVEKLGKTYVDPSSGEHKIDRTGIKVNGGEYKGGSIAANTWIYLPGELLDSGTVMSIRANSKGPVKRNVTYTVRAVAKNILDLEGVSKTSSLASFYETYQNICNDQYPYGTIPPVSVDGDGNPIPTDSSPVYYDEIKVDTSAKAIERLYDFRITDVKDVDWKNVFRNRTEHNGNAYYVGMRRWGIGEETAKPRTEYEVGSNPSRLLPIGPKKHTDQTYKAAPKLGYRFSFDVKLTGEYNSNKKVIIDVDFKYISKNGSVTNENIDLYYKNKSGKYVQIGSPQEDYDLTFIPNDGYRLLATYDESHLANESVSLYQDVSSYKVLEPNAGYTDYVETTLGGATSLTRIVLDASKMSTIEDNVMTLYGEYKLPNSTVAIDRTTGNIKDSKTYLKDGYIAIVFDIKYHHNKNNGWSMVSYSSPMKKSGSFPYDQGTSQWEYEGYLGFNYANNSEKNGNFALDKGMYIMESSSELGTNYSPIIFLYDIDARAATDFN